MSRLSPRKLLERLDGLRSGKLPGTVLAFRVTLIMAVRTFSAEEFEKGYRRAWLVRS